MQCRSNSSHFACVTQLQLALPILSTTAHVNFTFQQLYENEHGINHTEGKVGPRAGLDAIRHSQ
jgi:hypothetical protein